MLQGGCARVDPSLEELLAAVSSMSLSPHCVTGLPVPGQGPWTSWLCCHTGLPVLLLSGSSWALLFPNTNFFFQLYRKTVVSVIPPLLYFTTNSNPGNTMCHLPGRASRISIYPLSKTLSSSLPPLCGAGIACLCSTALLLLITTI